MTLVTTFAQNSWNFLYISGKGFLAGSRALFFEEAKSSPPLPTHPRSFSAPGADSSRICSSILISGKPGVHDLRAFAIVHRRLWRMCEWIGMPGWALYQSLYCLPVRRSVVITCRRLSTTMKRWSICWPPSALPPPPSTREREIIRGMLRPIVLPPRISSLRYIICWYYFRDYFILSSSELALVRVNCFYRKQSVEEIFLIRIR